MGQDEEKRRILWICLFVALVIVGVVFFVWKPFGKEAEKPLAVTDLQKEKSSKGKLLVYVVGAVKEPGVYELPEGARLYDAVQAAGDVLPYASMNEVNMAEPLADGTKVYIPLDPDQSDPRGNGLISINRASAKELTALPGVGEVTAEKICNYREEHGLFQRKEDLMKVPSIGEAKYKKLSDRITL
jgi:competence protein ComEA